jgi:hypothetical protein
LTGYRSTTPEFAAFAEDDEHDGGPRGAASLSSKEWAKQQLNHYLQWCKGKSDQVDKAKGQSWAEVPSWWYKTGRNLFPHLARVFQSLRPCRGGLQRLSGTSALPATS